MSNATKTKRSLNLRFVADLADLLEKKEEKLLQDLKIFLRALVGRKTQ